LSSLEMVPTRCSMATKVSLHHISFIPPLTGRQSVQVSVQDVHRSITPTLPSIRSNTPNWKCRCRFRRRFIPRPNVNGSNHANNQTSHQNAPPSLAWSLYPNRRRIRIRRFSECHLHPSNANDKRSQSNRRCMCRRRFTPGIHPLRTWTDASACPQELDGWD
jgi:hypothetical protein